MITNQQKQPGKSVIFLAKFFHFPEHWTIFLRQILRLSGILGGCFLTTGLAIAQTLPPPPPIPTNSTDSRATRTKVETFRSHPFPPVNSNSDNEREYTFSAPPATTPAPAPTTSSYRVEVYGGSDLILNQVRSLEPGAFRKGEIIQAGIFQKQKNAEELVRKLAIEGLWARIVTIER